MASAVLLANSGIINPWRYGVNSISKMNIVINENGTQDVGKVESLINFYQLMQNVGFVKDARDRYKTNESINLKNLIDTIKKENGRPVLFTISFEDSCGHALVAYEMQYNSDTHT